MADKVFNPLEWADNAPFRDNQSSTTAEHVVATANPTSDVLSDIETVTRRIEESQIDITAGYDNWRNCAFALASELGEAGRSFFHRISKFYTDYNQDETDKQYTACLKAGRDGITINTFFGLAKDAGVNISTQHPEELSTLSHLSNDKLDNCDNVEHSSDIEENRLPTFSDRVYDDLPAFCRSIVDKGTSVDDADLLLISSLVTLSGCFPKSYFSIYDDRIVYPQLYLFVVAPPASGKGRMDFARYLGSCIDEEKRQRYNDLLCDYKEALARKSESKKTGVQVEVPEEPQPMMLFMPANSSASAFYKTLSASDGEGIMFETEGDTLSYTLDKEYGNYSDGFRKMYQHEDVHYRRMKDYVHVKSPRLAVLLSGTPEQVTSLIPSAENGLFSRFSFYGLNRQCKFENKFNHHREPLSVYFKELGEFYYREIYQVFRRYPDDSIFFRFTPEQEEAIYQYFSQKYEEYIEIFGDDIRASVLRLTWITIRLGMILTAIRLTDQAHFTLPTNADNQMELVCNEADFKTSMAITGCLLEHMSAQFLFVQQFARSKKKSKVSDSGKGDKAQFLSELRKYKSFSRKDACRIAAQLSHPNLWADRLLKELINEGSISSPGQGKYEWC